MQQEAYTSLITVGRFFLFRFGLLWLVFFLLLLLLVLVLFFSFNFLFGFWPLCLLLILLLLVICLPFIPLPILLIDWLLNLFFLFFYLRICVLLLFPYLHFYILLPFLHLLVFFLCGFLLILLAPFWLRTFMRSFLTLCAGASLMLTIRTGRYGFLCFLSSLARRSSSCGHCE
ncbi:hypothetical protein BDV23DRAFT_142090 [Aspergillus alliaceus]|uniref:Uncharacterized protein n=1 Tax=Petromyces alliaceus TaxID=209559 RepID=A0A5N7BX19_PETAA|nr:hypothetical protein BDV23DRAFT_142090 [Aspergillus alliaceus]